MKSRLCGPGEVHDPVGAPGGSAVVGESPVSARGVRVVGGPLEADLDLVPAEHVVAEELAETVSEGALHIRGQMSRPTAGSPPDPPHLDLGVELPQREPFDGYLATVIDDVYSRRPLVWSMPDHIRTELVTDALESAVRTRSGRVDGVIFHSDPGAQYGAKAFAETCHRPGIRRFMGAVGTSADNDAAESFYASLKREILPGRHGWANHTSRPSHGLPPARLLQPPAQALHDRPPHPGRLRREINYAGHRCMTTGVSTIKVAAPSMPPPRAHDQRLRVAELAEQDRRIVRSGVANSTIRADERLRAILTDI